jgi:hypothetical protein
MNPDGIRSVTAAIDPGSDAPNATLTRFVAEVYEAAPPSVRCSVLETLQRPLNLFSLLAVANGIFAKAWLRSPGQELHLRMDDVQHVRAGDVMALVDYVQQVNIDAVYGLAQILSTSPVLTGSAAAALLLQLVLLRAGTRPNTTGVAGTPIPAQARNDEPS